MNKIDLDNGGGGREAAGERSGGGAELRERGVEEELSCGRAEGGGIALASCFSFAREMREVRLVRG
ncbi:hypothetical protein F2Q69_00008368 [Brassica cretica]|uniref:Uncharacterized protein n=1 Tax=Brassica cretica TaxID=69181 RepID=A0A8S9PJI3_BRACR|nr:hypothetical protein F2Q69_00008368 [Brassica cretica]